MESIVFCLRKAVMKQDEQLLLKICPQIISFILKPDNYERRGLLIESLCRGGIVTVLKDGITSNVKTLLVVMKLLCLLSESKYFLEHCWMVLKSTARALIFLLNSDILVRLQMEFIEIIFMVHILLKTHKHDNIAIQDDGEIAYTVKSLLNVCQSILKMPDVEVYCKLSTFFVFSAILNISKRQRLSSIINEGNLHMIMNITCLFLELSEHPELSKKKTISVYISLALLKMFSGIENKNNLYQQFFVRLIQELFQNHYWKFLFEDVSNIQLADFLITSFSWLFGRIAKHQPQILISIAEDCITRDGLEQLILFLSDKRCNLVLRLKTKILINLLIYAVKIKLQLPTQQILDANLVLDKLEYFSYLPTLDSAELFQIARSFINVVYVMVKYNPERCLGFLTKIQQGIFILLSTNTQKLKENEFWLIISVHQISKNLVQDHLGAQTFINIYNLNNEILLKRLQEETQKDNYLFQYEQLAWLKESDQHLFEGMVSSYLGQQVYDVNRNNCDWIIKLIPLDQIIYLLFSDNYNQVINSSKLFILLNPTDEHLHILLEICKNYDKISKVQFLSLLYILGKYLSNLSNQKEKCKYILQLLKGELTTISNHNNEFKIMLIDTICSVIRKCNFINVFVNEIQ